MASYGQHQMPPHAGGGAAPGYNAGYHHPQMAAAPGVPAPAGTFSPGTKIQVGSHRVVIQKYLSEGGFAHVYLVKLSKPIDGTEVAVLKRVAVPDKEALRGMRTEVETMKRLKGHRPIVTYIDSHASEMKGGGYEVFLLMEYCDGGGLIDFMNTRLQHRLTEPEILHIFADIAEGVACMHYLRPTLLHRDLKVENVLITSRGSSRRFKLCDFGSSAPPRPAPTSVVECRLMDEDVQKHTTLQYRSPEMIDVYRKQPLNEKADIWALGVLLYKLCYYTTPFEDQGQLAILNASYKYPSHPVFSDRLKILIGSMLKENLNARPNIYQVLKEACDMQGRKVPIKDIYAESPQTTSPSKSRTSSSDPKQQQRPVVGAVFSPEAEEKPVVPDIVPMRRGRPAASPAPSKSPQPATSTTKSDGDPFAALDSKNNRQSQLVDDLSSRFPSLDQFSLLHDQGAKFSFSPSSPRDSVQQDLPASSQQATNRLADDAFASHSHSPQRSHETSKTSTPAPQVSNRVAQSQNALSKVSSTSSQSQPSVSRAASVIRNDHDLRAISSQNLSKYVSTGTMTGDYSPEQERRSITTRIEELRGSNVSTPDPTSTQRQPVDMRPASNPRVSSVQAAGGREQLLSPSRVPLDGEHEEVDLPESASRTRHLATRPRPASTNFEPSTMDYLREREASLKAQNRSAQPSPRVSPMLIATADDTNQNIPPATADAGPSLIDLDNNDTKIRMQERIDKRASVPVSSGSKGVAVGKLGDAFKRFEGNAPASNGSFGRRTPSPTKELPRQDFNPVAASDTPDGRSEDLLAQADADDLSPEMRRELERRQLLEEEQRVEKAQAEYRKRVAISATGPAALPRTGAVGPPRASSIQNRVQSLMSEDQSAPIQRTAQGYGKYSDAAAAATKTAPQVPRKPVAVSKGRADLSSQPKSPAVGIVRSGTAPSSAPPAVLNKPPAKPPAKPAAPKKPIHLNSIPTGSGAKPTSPIKLDKELPAEPLVAVDLPGQPGLDMTEQEKDDYLQDFSKRFPSLNAIETGERRPSGR